MVVCPVPPLPVQLQKDPDLCVFTRRQDHLFLCPYSIKWAEIPENVFSLLLQEERHELLTKHSITDFCWSTELFNTHLT